MEEAYNKINYTLVRLFNEIMELEGRAIITDEFRDITNNDMHVIEAIGDGDGNNMTSVANALGVTVGTLTSAVNSLVLKQYVTRRRTEKDRRVVIVQLTDKGKRAFEHHAHYHQMVTNAVVERFGKEELPLLLKLLEALDDFFTSEKKRIGF